MGPTDQVEQIRGIVDQIRVERRAMSHPLDRKLVVEFIGTFFLVFTVGCATAALNRTAPVAPIAIGSALMVMIFAGGHISGGHYNPAVSTAVLIRGKIAPNEWAAYVVTQLVAGVVGGLLASAVFHKQTAGALANNGRQLLVEFLFTFALAWVVLNVATARGTEGNSFYGLAIGFTVLAGAFAVGPISGGAFNPAVALGQTVHGALRWGHVWVYLVANFAGGIAAGAAFLYVQPTEKAGGDLEAGRA
jgi:aquaporin Z